MLCAGRTALGASELLAVVGKATQVATPRQRGLQPAKKANNPGQLQGVITRRVGAGTRRSAFGVLEDRHSIRRNRGLTGRIGLSPSLRHEHERRAD